MLSSVPNDTVIYAWNFRGFNRLRIPLRGILFLVGDNSSGKSSILHLVSCVLTRDLEDLPALNEELSVGRYDYFSAYLGDKDVTFAYEFKNENGRVGKIVTVRKQSSGVPKVMRCSLLVGRTLATIKRYGNNLRKKITEVHEDEDFDKLFEIHNIDKDFKKSDKSSRRNVEPNSPLALVDCFDDKVIDDKNLFEAFTSSLPAVRHIAPVRGLPERFYDFKRTLTSSGKHFAVMWQDLKGKRTEQQFAKVRQFGKDSGLFDDIHVEPLSKRIDDAPLIVRIEKQGREFFLNQVGVGLSQVVPVLVEAIFACLNSKHQVIQYQQPELHLHPIAQAELGSFFYSTIGRSGCVLLIETHSNFLIDRFRSEIRDDKNESPPTSIYFCENSDTGNKFTEILVDSGGCLIEPPPSYFRFFVSEFSRTIF